MMERDLEHPPAHKNDGGDQHDEQRHEAPELVLIVLLDVALLSALDRFVTHFMASLAVGVSVLVERTLELGD